MPLQQNWLQCLCSEKRFASELVTDAKTSIMLSFISRFSAQKTKMLVKPLSYAPLKHFMWQKVKKVNIYFALIDSFIWNYYDLCRPITFKRHNICTKRQIVLMKGVPKVLGLKITNLLEVRPKAQIRSKIHQTNSKCSLFLFFN